MNTPAFPASGINTRFAEKNSTTFIFEKTISWQPNMFIFAIVITLGIGKPSVALAQSCAKVSTEILSWWPGDGNANDIVGSNNGTLQNNAGFTKGQVRQAFNLNDNNSAHMSVPNSASLNVGTGDFTMEAWVKSNAAKDIATIMDTRTYVGSTIVGYHWYLSYAGFAGLQIGGQGGSVFSSESNIFIPDGNFHHLAVVVSRNSKTSSKFFVDGLVVNTFDITSFKGNPDNSANFLLGGHSFDSWRTFNGLIDEFSLYNRALSDSEILAIFQAGSAGKCMPSSIAELHATTLSPSTIRLSWDTSDTSAVGYRIQSKEGDCKSTKPWVTRADVSTEKVIFDDRGLLSDTTYAYQMSSHYGAGAFSDYSTCVSATTGVAGTPNTPLHFSARSRTDALIDLAWNDAAEDETAFNIFRQVNAGSLTLLDSVAAGVQRYSDNTATGNSSTTAYQYDVRACNGAGCSRPNTAVVIPFKPTNPKASSSKNVHLTWKDNSSNESGFEIWRKIGACNSDNPWTMAHTATADATTYDDAGAVPGTDYAYRIRAFNSNGTKPPVNGYSDYSVCVNTTAP